MSILLLSDLKELAHADLAKEKKKEKKKTFGMNFYCLRYDFSVALISALALLKYAIIRLTGV